MTKPDEIEAAERRGFVRALERAAQECDEHAEYFAAQRIRALIPPAAAPAAETGKGRGEEGWPFDKRCADALADEVAVLIQRKVIDSRSPAADALLDYREPPRSPRSDRIAELEALVAEANRQLDALAAARRECEGLRSALTTIQAMARSSDIYGDAEYDAEATAALAAPAAGEEGKWRAP